MDNNSPITLRVKFKKVGKLQYISHLDLVRTMNKIVVRAKLPLWYTEGFNPKPKMTFAAPLSVGTESLCEFMDVRLVERIEPRVAIDALNMNMTDELVVLDAYYPQSKLTQMRWLTYLINIDTKGNVGELAQKCSDALSADSIIVKKKAKLGGAEMQIRHLIKEAHVSCEAGVIKIRCVLSSEPSSFLNPEYVVKYLKESCGVLSSENLAEESYTILRLSAHSEDMSEYR